jgi:hypothetical protein
MKTSERVAIAIPMKAIWQEDGSSVTERLASLSVPEIAELLRSGPVRFVVADVGKPLQWIPLGRCFEFWKTEVKHNVCGCESNLPLDAYPESYCFAASLWKNIAEPASAQPIILLEKHH